MDNNVYITLSRQLALFRDMDVTAGNIANANTTGYNGEHITFGSYLTKDVNQGVTNPMSFAYNISTYRDTRTGSMKATGNVLDMAINGDGYFAVETPLGTRYTRAGNFQVDGGGTLVTAEGYPVLDNAGQHIIFPEDTTSIEVTESGVIRVNDDDFANIGVAVFENPQLLERLGGTLFASEVTPAQSDDVHIAQGTLENANVQPVVEMTHMMDVSRAVANTAKFIEIMYDLQRKTANTWAQQS
jgi:flagellar basal-body rod protein FlgF